MFQKPKKTKQRSRTAKNNKEYLALREAFLNEHFWCQVCKEEIAMEVHHKAGRRENLLKIETWLAVCPGCHRIIHDQPAWAREQGYMESRL